VREIDLASWSRREHFEVFRAFHYAHFNICAPVDTTALVRAVREQSISVNTAVVYVLTRAANDVPEFRRRIRDGAVVEHEVVHPSSTVMVEGDVFTFSFFDYQEDFAAFARHVAEATARVRADPSLADPPGRDDLLFMTAIPWVSFTSFAHPIATTPADSIPRFAWGRISDRDGQRTMPLSVQVHHALVDGVHAGRWYERVQAYLDAPEAFLA
jgi:chloramphenicol O-acetyltransferase type A